LTRMIFRVDERKEVLKLLFFLILKFVNNSV
jgi:hypothetical protein